MTEHFNKLTPAELERLAHLAEECSEVIKAVNKIIRHGYNSFDPTDPNHKGNRSDLEKEIGDLYAIIGLMALNKDVDIDKINQFMFDRTIKTKNLYYHHQDMVKDYPSEPDFDNSIIYEILNTTDTNSAKSIDDVIKDLSIAIEKAFKK